MDNVIVLASLFFAVLLKVGKIPSGSHSAPLFLAIRSAAAAAKKKMIKKWDLHFYEISTSEVIWRLLERGVHCVAGVK